jgi:hypothetical protein
LDDIVKARKNLHAIEEKKEKEEKRKQYQGQ